MQRVYSSLPCILYVENGMKVQLKYPPSPKFAEFSECVKGAPGSPHLSMQGLASESRLQPGYLPFTLMYNI